MNICIILKVVEEEVVEVVVVGIKMHSMQNLRQK
jgi:hypothetical protein